MPIERRKLFSGPELKIRGWTPAAIARFLPLADDTRPNPKYSSAGAPMKFYLIRRVTRVERKASWRSWLEGSQKRKEAAAKAVQTKTAGLQNHVESIEIEVPQMSAEELLRRAVEHYNSFWAGTEKRAASANSDPAFLNRISVNFLRHELTRYEQHVDEVAGKTGAPDARGTLREIVYDRIAEVYPHLSAECCRQ